VTKLDGAYAIGRVAEHDANTRVKMTIKNEIVLFIRSSLPIHAGFLETIGRDSVHRMNSPDSRMGLSSDPLITLFQLSHVK